jgi:hypothetical protein
MTAMEYISHMEDEQQKVLINFVQEKDNKIEALEEMNEKWGIWANDVIYWSHTNSLGNLELKKLITKDNTPCFDGFMTWMPNENKKLKEEINHKNKKFVEWGEENKKLKEDNEIQLNVNLDIFVENKEVKEMNERLNKKVGELKKENRKNACCDLYKTFVNKLEEENKKLKEEKEALVMNFNMLDKHTDNIDKLFLVDNFNIR